MRKLIAILLVGTFVGCSNRGAKNDSEDDPISPLEALLNPPPADPLLFRPHPSAGRLRDKCTG